MYFIPVLIILHVVVFLNFAMDYYEWEKNIVIYWDDIYLETTESDSKTFYHTILYNIHIKILYITFIVNDKICNKGPSVCLY
jgi:hypothetical protein